MLGDVSFDGLDQFVNISKATTSDLLFSDVSKEALALGLGSFHLTETLRRVPED